MTNRRLPFAAAEKPVSGRSHAHVCAACGAGAPFGFTTRTGMLWVCADHRAEGRRVMVPPDPLRRTAEPARGRN